jgi:hypothetical protein
VEQLQTNPETPVADLLNPPVQLDSKSNMQGSGFPPQIHHESADLIQICFPEMQQMLAEALENLEVLELISLPPSIGPSGVMNCGSWEDKSIATTSGYSSQQNVPIITGE